MHPVHRILFDYFREDWLFITDGRPDITALELWRTGGTRVYRAVDAPDALITIDTHGFATEWLFCTPVEEAELTPPLPPRPWISYDEVTYGLRRDELAAFDAWVVSRFASPTTPPAHWDEFTRPVLVRAAVERFRPLPPPSQPSASSAPPLAPPSPPPTPLPPHVQRILIEHAVATQAVCPITLEPIDNAAVAAATVTTTPCGHVFAIPLPPEIRACPVCRGPLPPPT